MIRNKSVFLKKFIFCTFYYFKNNNLRSHLAPLMEFVYNRDFILHSFVNDDEIRTVYRRNFKSQRLFVNN